MPDPEFVEHVRVPVGDVGENDSGMPELFDDALCEAARHGFRPFARGPALFYGRPEDVLVNFRPLRLAARTRRGEWHNNEHVIFAVHTFNSLGEEILTPPRVPHAVTR